MTFHPGELSCLCGQTGENILYEACEHLKCNYFGIGPCINIWFCNSLFYKSFSSVFCVWCHLMRLLMSFRKWWHSSYFPVCSWIDLHSQQKFSSLKMQCHKLEIWIPSGGSAFPICSPDSRCTSGVVLGSGWSPAEPQCSSLCWWFSSRLCIGQLWVCSAALLTRTVVIFKFFNWGVILTRLPVALQHSPLSARIPSEHGVSLAWQGPFSITLNWLSLISLLFFLSPDPVWFSFPLFCPELTPGKWIAVYLSHFAFSWCGCARNVSLPNLLLHSEKYCRWARGVCEIVEDSWRTLWLNILGFWGIISCWNAELLETLGDFPVHSPPPGKLKCLPRASLMNVFLIFP